MKFEHVLHIYWANHFLFNGRISDFNTTPRDLFTHVGGLKQSTKQALIHRFELLRFTGFTSQLFATVPRGILRGMNILFSQISTVNNQTSEVVRLALVRLYLIRSRRGRFQAVGKPVRGQRTWSNAWTAHYKPSPLRAYIAASLKKQGGVKEEKKDYRRIARKFKKKKTTPTGAKKTKKSYFLWF